MRKSSSVPGLALVAMIAAATSHAQSAQSSTSLSIPRVISISGTYQPANGQPAPVGTVVTLSIYASEEGGTAFWQETQNVVLDNAGRFSLLLGATQPDSIPMEIFTSGEARWLGMHFAGLGETERPRTRITTVPYAVRASDADTLGGKPASAYLLAPTTDSSSTTGGATPTTTASTASVSAAIINPGFPGQVVKYAANGVDVTGSAIYEAAGRVGVGTFGQQPFDFMHVRFNSLGSGGVTGYAVQNLSGTANSYSGMLFYDHLGNLSQFQGFNNVTHEYRINNIASNGSINFMLAGTSRFLVGSNGNIGIGTTTPISPLEVSNANNPSTAGMIFSTTFTNAGTSWFVGRRARGTGLAPAAVQSGDNLVGFLAEGYGATGFSTLPRGGMFVSAAENWTDAAQGTKLSFLTTATGTNTQQAQMTIDPAGRVGIGTGAPSFPLEVSRSGADALIATTAYGTGVNSFFIAQSARGTAAAPSAVQLGDFLGGFAMSGFGTTSFNDVFAAVAAGAAENFTDTTRGTALILGTTPVGTKNLSIAVGILPSGSVGIGTPQDANGLPTATDKLQIFGDARVGTSGTNGCIKRFDGTGIVGTCASDRRFKKDITPFGPMLDHLTALQPVHYYWRAAEFPERHFGESRAYGLIAQDVEQVLPDLVVTGEDGYKAVDYTKLPLLTIQALKELNLAHAALTAENERLKKESEDLKARVAELERLIGEIRTSPRQ
jgi:endosialidase-like protein